MYQAVKEPRPSVAETQRQLRRSDSEVTETLGKPASLKCYRGLIDWFTELDLLPSPRVSLGI